MADDRKCDVVLATEGKWRDSEVSPNALRWNATREFFERWDGEEWIPLGHKSDETSGYALEVSGVGGVQADHEDGSITFGTFDSDGNIVGLKVDSDGGVSVTGEGENSILTVDAADDRYMKVDEAMQGYYVTDLDDVPADAPTAAPIFEETTVDEDEISDDFDSLVEAFTEKFDSIYLRRGETVNYPIGTVIAFLGGYITPRGTLPADGRILTECDVRYPRLWEKVTGVTDTPGALVTCPFDEWTSETKEENNGFFGLDLDGKRIRLPKIGGYLAGEGMGGSPGSPLAAGLPDITGSFKFEPNIVTNINGDPNDQPLVSGASGAFYLTASNTQQCFVSGTTAPTFNHYHTVNFHANTSSPVYKSTVSTVIPRSVTVRFCIVVDSFELDTVTLATRINDLIHAGMFDDRIDSITDDYVSEYGEYYIRNMIAAGRLDNDIKAEIREMAEALDYTTTAMQEQVTAYFTTGAGTTLFANYVDNNYGDVLYNNVLNTIVAQSTARFEGWFEDYLESTSGSRTVTNLVNGLISSYVTRNNLNQFNETAAVAWIKKYVIYQSGREDIAHYLCNYWYYNDMGAWSSGLTTILSDVANKISSNTTNAVQTAVDSRITQWAYSNFNSRVTQYLTTTAGGPTINNIIANYLQHSYTPPTPTLSVSDVSPAVSTYLGTTAGQNRLSQIISGLGYISSDSLAPYATTASLSSYVTNDALNTAIASFVTMEDLEDAGYNLDEVSVSVLIQDALTEALSSYVSASSLTSTLSSYATSSSVASALSDYMPSDDIEDLLAQYALKSDLTGYVKTQNVQTVVESFVTTALAQYATTSSVTAALRSYVTTSDLLSSLASYTTRADVIALVNAYVTGSDLSELVDTSSFITSSSLTTALQPYVTAEQLEQRVGEIVVSGGGATSLYVDDLDDVPDDLPTGSIIMYEHEGEEAEGATSLYVDDLDDVPDDLPTGSIIMYEHEGEEEDFVTSAEVSSAISAATGDFVTSAEVSSAISAATGDFVTSAEVSSAISAATGDFVTSAEVSSAISAAVGASGGTYYEDSYGGYCKFNSGLALIWGTANITSTAGARVTYPVPVYRTPRMLLTPLRDNKAWVAETTTASCLIKTDFEYGMIQVNYLIVGQWWED